MSWYDTIYHGAALRGRYCCLFFFAVDGRIPIEALLRCVYHTCCTLFATQAHLPSRCVNGIRILFVRRGAQTCCTPTRASTVFHWPLQLGPQTMLARGTGFVDMVAMLLGSASRSDKTRSIKQYQKTVLDLNGGLGTREVRVHVVYTETCR